MNSIEKSQFRDEVEKVIRNNVAPIINEHGGIINIKSIENGVVTVTLEGKCNGCPSSQITTEQIVKECLVKKLGDKIVDVKLYSEVSDELWNFAKTLLRHEHNKESLS